MQRGGGDAIPPGRCNQWKPFHCQSRSLHTANKASMSSKKSLTLLLALDRTTLSPFSNLLIAGDFCIMSSVSCVRGGKGGSAF